MMIRLSPHSSQNAPSNSCRFFSRATFCGSLRESDTAKAPSAFAERLTDAVSYTAKWLKSSLEKLSEKGYGQRSEREFS
jgi:hypothetical protein